MIISELLIFPAKMVPFAARTWRYRASNAVPEPTPGGRGVEVYEEGGVATGPLIVYVHGGSWGQGAAWQYALLARRLLEGGASRVAIVKYGLFPEADVDEMVDDVAAALEWGREQQRNMAERGGRRLPVVLAAQSAGAHLCALLLSRRAGAMAPTADAAEAAWMPDRFVALSGVFDIAPHFRHESGRLVHWLSPMWQAMRGRPHADGGGAGGAEPPKEQQAALLGLSDALRDAARPVSGAPSAWSEADLAAWAAASPTRLLRLQRADAVAATDDDDTSAAVRSTWPPTVVLHAADDGTVPVASAREFVEALRAVGGDVAYSEVGVAGHGEVMIALMGRTPLAELPAGLADITTRFVSSAAAEESLSEASVEVPRP